MVVEVSLGRLVKLDPRSYRTGFKSVGAGGRGRRQGRESLGFLICKTDMIEHLPPKVAMRIK